jgi:hypothetical protein
MIFNILISLKNNSDYTLSQCYDGASVMSGIKGSVQALIQKELNT